WPDTSAALNGPVSLPQSQPPSPFAVGGHRRRQISTGVVGHEFDESLWPSKRHVDTCPAHLNNCVPDCVIIGAKKKFVNCHLRVERFPLADTEYGEASAVRLGCEVDSGNSHPDLLSMCIHGAIGPLHGGTDDGRRLLTSVISTPVGVQVTRT